MATNKNLTNAGEGAEKREFSYTVGGNVNWYNTMETLWRFLKKIKLELLYGLAIPLLGTHLEKTLIQKDTYTPKFLAALFTTSKTWKQPKCPLTDEWIKMWYIYTMEYYSAVKNEIMPFTATWIIIINEVRNRRTNII